jgi:hypothetical protein
MIDPAYISYETLKYTSSTTIPIQNFIIGRN